MKKTLLLATFTCLTLSLLKAQISETVIKETLQQSLKNEHFVNYLQVSCKITDNYKSNHNGMTHVYMNQLVNGLEVFNSNSAMHFDQNGKLVVFHNQFIDNAANIASNNTPKIAAIDALKTGTIKEGLNISTTMAKTSVEIAGKTAFVDAASSEKMYAKLGYLLHDNKLQLVWQIEFYNDKTNDWWNMHIDAKEGTLMQQNSYTAHCNFSQIYHSGQTIKNSNFFENEIIANKKAATGTYSVFPLPFESPQKGPKMLMSNMATANASPFGWHDTDGVAGAEFTITRGNNVWAKEDTLANNGSPNPGYSPDGGANLVFDFPFDVTAKPNVNLNAAITNLFYWNNLLHDIFNNYGFNEEAGNYQQKNYSGKGIGADPVMADALDGSGTGNANFAAPVDGSSGRMQMYLWPTAGASVNNTLQILSPSKVKGIYAGPQSQFGSKLTMDGIYGNIVLLKDSGATTSLGCGLISNAADLNGKIALIDRGTCTFPIKVLAAQNAGAIAAIVVNSNGGAATAMTGSDNSITIPSIMISKTLGTSIKSAITSDTVYAHLYDSSANNTARIYDGDFDNGVISHEFGHGISIRLTGGPANSNCLNNKEQAGEGWSDFFALALTTRTWEKSASIARGLGTFVIDQDTNGLGIRTYKYSHNMTINPVTYKTIITQSEVHSLGFVFCSMLYDIYWDMIDRYGFDPDVYNGHGGNNKTIQLVIDGLKLQPCSPGFVDSRNAIIKADSMNNGGANYDLLWRAFARRGLGYSATQGSSNSATDGVEKYDLPPGVSGIETHNIELNTSLYPNPTHVDFTIDLFGGNMIKSVEIFDISGKLIISENYENASLPSATINIAQFNKGLYLVKVKGTQGSVCKKLIID